jgi:hypothetical protein
MRKNRKSQVYGLSAFIYALAIAIILIVGLLGLSKEYDFKASAGLYRFSSVITIKNAEIVKKLMDQERGYTVDKSLFITGAFGGYSPDVDLICQKGCVGNCGTINPSLFSTCFPNIINPDSPTQHCGAIVNNDPYMGEKYVPRWKYNVTGIQATCIPSLNNVINTTFVEFAGSRFTKPSQILLGALSAATRLPIEMEYKLQLDNVNETSGAIETSWFAYMSPDVINIVAPQPPDEPIVEYSFKPFVHITSNTSFFSIYNEAKSFALVPKYVANALSKNSIVPTIIDKDFSVNINMEPPKPFKVLVEYANNTLPNEPNECTVTTAVSAEYPHDCGVVVHKSNGEFIVGWFDYYGYCGERDGSAFTHHTNDDIAMRCVMKRVINNLNSPISDVPFPTSLKWTYNLQYVNISLKGAVNNSN